MTKAIERVETKGSLAVVPAHLKQYVGMADDEQVVGREDMLIPRLAVAQDGMSPQLKKASELYIPELEAGDLFNTVTNEIYGPTATVIPLFFTKNYIEFAPNMGGVLGQYSNAAELPKGGLDWGRDPEDGSPIPPRITEFKNRMCLIETEAGYQPIVVSFKKGEVKFSDQWNSQIKFARMADALPCFAHTYTITSKLKNKGQQSWYVKTIAPLGFTPENIFGQAKSYFEQLNQGGYTVDTTGIEADTKEADADTSFDQD
jgi:hypothetical protein